MLNIIKHDSLIALAIICDNCQLSRWRYYNIQGKVAGRKLFTCWSKLPTIRKLNMFLPGSIGRLGLKLDGKHSQERNSCNKNLLY